MKADRQERLLKIMQNKLYYAEEDGAIFSRAKSKNCGRRLKPHLLRSGYELVSIYAGERDPIRCLVHQFVYLYFHGLYPSDVQINHIDGVKTNNAVSNLELLSRSDNMKHSYRLGLQSQRGEMNNGSRLTALDVLTIRELFHGGMRQNKIAEKFSVAQSTISAVVTGTNWNHIPQL